MVQEEVKSHWKVILYIILAIAIACAIIYVSGLIVQLGGGMINYIFTGLLNDEPFPEIKWGFFGSAGYTFTTAGLIIAGIITVMTLVAIFGRRRINRRKVTTKDERGFKALESGMYGTAEWMTDKEAKEVLKVIPQSTGMEFPLGLDEEGELICLPDNIMGDNQNTIIFGPPGTGKTRCIILNHIIGAINKGESIIVPDTKGELYNITSEYARKKGYQVRVLNLIDPDHSDSWNVMANIDLDMDVGNISQTIVNNSGDVRHSDEFWSNSELNLLKAIMLHVMTKEPECNRNLPFMYQKMLEGIDQLTAYITDNGMLTSNSPEWASWQIFNQNVKDTTQGAFIQGLATRLQILQNPKICSILKGNTIDLSMPAYEKCAYYMILDTQNSNMEFLSSLFFNFLFERLIHWADTEGRGRCKVPVRIILDEFTNLGRLGVSADGSDFVQTLSLTRSRFINATMAVQTLGQLQTKYPRELSSALLGNTAFWLLLGCNDELTAKLFSDRSGDMTVEVRSERTARKNLTPYQWIPEYMENEGAGKRKLVNPDEVQRMKQVFGDRALLISMEGHNMLKAEKFDYSENASYHKLIKGDIGAYDPIGDGFRAPVAENNNVQDEYNGTDNESEFTGDEIQDEQAQMSTRQRITNRLKRDTSDKKQKKQKKAKQAEKNNLGFGVKKTQQKAQSTTQIKKQTSKQTDTQKNRQTTKQTNNQTDRRHTASQKQTQTRTREKEPEKEIMQQQNVEDNKNGPAPKHMGSFDTDSRYNNRRSGADSMQSELEDVDGTGMNW